MKTKGISESQFMALLQKVLPEAIEDPHLAASVYERMAKELRMMRSLERFEKFCAEGALPDLEPATVANLQNDLSTTFGEENVTVEPDEDGKAVAVEISLPNRKVETKLKVQTPGEEVAEEEVKSPFVPFPVSLPEDPELLWVLARRENIAPDDAGRALAGIEEEFWATKAGQKLLKDRVERTFAEFVANVPAGMLADLGLKRHYKEPEPRRTLRRLPPREGEKLERTVTGEAPAKSAKSAKSGKAGKGKGD